MSCCSQVRRCSGYDHDDDSNDDDDEEGGSGGFKGSLLKGRERLHGDEGS